MTYDAILFASFGGPEGQDDVLPFLRNVTRGRGIPDERLEQVAGHYRALGGRSPINDQNRALIAALEAELARRGIDLPVYWGNRNWAPYTGDTLAAMHADGHRRVLALATSAYSSYSSCRQYREDFARGLDEHGLLDELTIDKVQVYFDQRGFLEPVADGVRTALAELAADHDEIEVLFSTHSIPLTMAEESGPEPAGEGGWYVAQHLAACTWVMEQIGEPTPPWRLVYQSRSGNPRTPWLEPDVNDVIEEIAAEGRTTAVVVVPIGFVSDHVEVIWDLDTEARETAETHRLGFRRVATSGTDPRFVASLVDLVAQALTPGAGRAGVTGAGLVEGTCGRTCCRVADGADTGRSVEPLSEIAARLRAQAPA